MEKVDEVVGGLVMEGFGTESVVGQGAGAGLGLKATDRVWKSERID